MEWSINDGFSAQVAPFSLRERNDIRGRSPIIKAIISQTSTPHLRSLNRAKFEISNQPCNLILMTEDLEGLI